MTKHQSISRETKMAFFHYSERYGVPNHRQRDCWLKLNSLFRLMSKKTQTLRIIVSFVRGHNVISISMSQYHYLCRIITARVALTLFVQKFSEGTLTYILHFMSLLHIDITQVPEILPHVRPGPTYSISWLLMSWRRKEPGHRQPWYWPS